jgi:hypothetical protein
LFLVRCVPVARDSVEPIAGFTHQRQRRCGLQPKVAELARLPWDIAKPISNRNAVVAGPRGFAACTVSGITPIGVVMLSQR